MLTNLGHDETAYVGRANEIASLMGLLRQQSLVTVVGPGGIGKTRLAREVARQSDADEVWFVDMSASDHGLRNAIATTAGVPVADNLEHALSNRGPVLLVLDNLDDILEEAIQVVGEILAACENVRFLVTSREALRISSEVVERLNPLRDDESRDLFAKRAGDRATGDDTGLDALLTALDGYPLAIELAASRVGILTLTQIRERLESDISILRSKARDVPERHRTMEAAVQSSWELLADAERDVLCQLSVFPGGFDLSAAEGVVVCDDWVGDVLESLVDRSLLHTIRDEAGNLRFALPHFMRVFCRAKVEPDALQALFARHAEHFCDREHSALDDTEDLYVAARRVNSDELATRCVYACEYAAKISGGFSRYRDLAHEILDGLNTRGTASEALLLRCRALANLGMRRLNSAFADAQAAVDLARKLGDRKVEAFALPTLGMTHLELGSMDLAMDHLNQALELAEELGLHDVEVIARQKLGIVLFISGHPTESEDEIRKSWRLAENIGYTYEAARSLSTLAVIKKEMGAYDDARRFFEAALEQLAVLDDRVTTALTRINLADLLVQMERPDEAETHYREALQVARSAGDRLRQSAALLGLVESGASDDPEQVANWLHEAANCLEAIDAYAERTRAWLTYAVFELGRGRPARALEALHRGRESVEPIKHAWAMGLLSSYGGIAYAAEGRPNQSDAAFADAEQFWSEPECESITGDLQFFKQLAESLLSGVEIDTEPWRLRAAEVANDPRMRTPMWIQHNHIRTLLALYRRLAAAGPSRMQITRDGRTLIGLDGEEHDFSRRGPLRRIMVALAEAATDQAGHCLSTEELIEAGYPEEVMTYDSGRTRIYAAIRRLRKLGLEDVIDTRDEGYLVPPEITIDWLD